jgi:hypothetical protein
MCSGRTWYACSSVILLTLTPVDIRRQVRNKVEGRYYVHDKRNISVVICDTNILQQLIDADGDHKTLEMLTDLPCKCSRVIFSSFIKFVFNIYLIV